jgi:hypothetical protein
MSSILKPDWGPPAILHQYPNRQLCIERSSGSSTAIPLIIAASAKNLCLQRQRQQEYFLGAQPLL